MYNLILLSCNVNKNYLLFYIIMGYKYKTKPYAHQEQALMKGAEAYSYAYFMEMGTGK